MHSSLLHHLCRQSPELIGQPCRKENTPLQIVVHRDFPRFAHLLLPEVEQGRITGPEAQTKGRAPYFMQRALDALSHARFFAGIAKRAFIFESAWTHSG